MRAAITADDVRAASERIAGRVHRTPIFRSRLFDEAAGREVLFKCENLQRAGAFKIRGAMNKLLSLTAEERSRGVVAFSSGNHAQAVALAARDNGSNAVIAMPSDAPRMKVEATKSYGAEVVFYDRLKDDREQVAREIADKSGRVIVPPYDDPFIIAGQGTCALELFEDAAKLDVELDALVTPCGGGGLFAGMSTAAKSIKPTIRCFAVEAETANDTEQSFRKGERVCIPPPATIADGIRNQAPGALTFPILQQNAEDVLLVSDKQIIEAMRFLLFRLKILVEPTGAVAVAAVLFGKLPPDVGKVGVILSGGNVDADALAKLVAG